jgi:hypothetical protein
MSVRAKEGPAAAFFFGYGTTGTVCLHAHGWHSRNIRCGCSVIGCGLPLRSCAFSHRRFGSVVCGVRFADQAFASLERGFALGDGTVCLVSRGSRFIFTLGLIDSARGRFAWVMVCVESFTSGGQLSARTHGLIASSDDLGTRSERLLARSDRRARAVRCTVHAAASSQHAVRCHAHSGASSHRQSAFGDRSVRCAHRSVAS